jgi:hypothetical protein
MRPSAVGRCAFDTKETGMMRTRTIGRAGFLSIAWSVLVAGAASAQPFPATTGGDATGYAPPDTQLPIPVGSTHPESGLFIAGAYTLVRETNPINDQTLAVRGFIPVDNSIAPGTAGHLIGSGKQALNTQQVSGPNRFDHPGVIFELGYKFVDGSALSLRWMYLLNSRTAASAGPVPPNFNTGGDFEDSFLTSFVVNVPPGFSGPPNKIGVGSPSVAFGIWNGATTMYEDFIQRTQQWDVIYRWTVYDTECYRLSGIIGPRFFWIWERFRWRTVDFPSNDVGVVVDPSDVGIYNNIVSNRMYGVHVGCGQEWYLGRGFACNLDVEGALLMDIVKERVDYELGLGSSFAAGRSKRALTDWRLVPGAEATLGLAWYPYEGIQMRLDYNITGVLNTIGMRQPVSFDFSGLDPRYNSQARLLDGFRAWIGFSF